MPQPSSVAVGRDVAAGGRDPAGAAQESPQPRFVLAWGTKGDKPGEFYSPIGIAISNKDQVYVTDVNNARVQKFTADGKYLGGFELPWDAPRRKSNQAGGIAIDVEGLIYLTYMSQDKVQVFNDQGQLVREWGRTGNGDGEFRSPGGIVLAPDKTVFVADQRNHRVQQFSREGKFLAVWGKHGAAPGEFGGPEAAGSRYREPRLGPLVSAVDPLPKGNRLAHVHALHAVPKEVNAARRWQRRSSLPFRQCNAIERNFRRRFARQFYRQLRVQPRAIRFKLSKALPHLPLRKSCL
jgi:hypothetical protein